MNAPSCDVAIVGGGIIGLSCALYLREAGHDVLLVEADSPANGASRGNAGALAFAEIFPLASPRIMRKAVRWLFDPLGPLSLPPSYLPRIAPWLLRFWQASWPRHYQANIQAQAALTHLAETEMMGMLARTGLAHHLRTEGALEVYEGARSYAAGRETARLRQLHGIDSRPVQGAELAALQPGLSSRFTHGILVSRWHNVNDPQALALAIGQKAQALGARLLKGRVHALVPDGQAAILRLDGGRQARARCVVIAAGAQSHWLSGPLGDKIPLETERGYNTTLPPGALALPRQITFVDHGFVVSPLGGGVRVGGAVELAGLKRPPDFRRAQAMLDKAKAFLPDLDTRGGTQWMGFRPSLPDSLPVIGRARHHPAILYAFGHGHLGLTQSAATARLVRDLVDGRAPAIDLQPYRPGRFF